MQPFSPHARFFSSLDRVEERLALEKKQKLSPRIEPTPKSEFKEPNSSTPQSDSLCSPLYLGYPKSNPPGPDNSGPALDFLSDTETPQDEEQVPEEKDGGEMNLVKDCGKEKDIEQMPERKRLDEWIKC